MTKPITLNTEQQTALERIKAGGNYFVFGRAGSGKTTLLKKLMSELNNAVFLAPTGNAASILNGSTIHRFMRFPALSILTQLNIDTVSKKHRKVIMNTKTVIIDEISMVRVDLLCAIDYRLRQYAQTPEMSKLPFGGRQVILCGDFFQLPPVVSGTERINGIGIAEYLEHWFGSIYAFSAPVWKQANIQPICLHQSMRQREDTEFADMLNMIKLADPMLQDEILQKINSRVGKEIPSECITLCTTNAAAKAINNNAYQQLRGEEREFPGTVSGNYSFEPSDEMKKTLKVGERVIMTANQYPNVFTGNAGTIVAFTPDNEVVVKFDSGHTETIRAFEKTQYDYHTEKSPDGGEPIIKSIPVGTFSQIPLIPGGAITIHRAQGMTLQNVVIDLRGGCFVPGQAYVGLSRCTSLGNLYLKIPLQREHLSVSPEVISADLSWNYDPVRLHLALLAVKAEQHPVGLDSLRLDTTHMPLFLSLIHEKYRTMDMAEMTDKIELSTNLQFMEKKFYDAIVCLYIDGCHQKILNKLQEAMSIFLRETQ